MPKEINAESTFSLLFVPHITGIHFLISRGIADVFKITHYPCTMTRACEIKRDNFDCITLSLARKTECAPCLCPPSLSLSLFPLRPRKIMSRGRDCAIPLELGQQPHRILFSPAFACAGYWTECVCVWKKIIARHAGAKHRSISLGFCAMLPLQLCSPTRDQ